MHLEWTQQLGNQSHLVLCTLAQRDELISSYSQKPFSSKFHYGNTADRHLSGSIQFHGQTVFPRPNFMESTSRKAIDFPDFIWSKDSVGMQIGISNELSNLANQFPAGPFTLEISTKGAFLRQKRMKNDFSEKPRKSRL